jgi:hypothetical protein
MKKNLLILILLLLISLMVFLIRFNVEHFDIIDDIRNERDNEMNDIINVPVPIFLQVPKTENLSPEEYDLAFKQHQANLNKFNNLVNFTNGIVSVVYNTTDTIKIMDKIKHYLYIKSNNNFILDILENYFEERKNSNGFVLNKEGKHKMLILIAKFMIDTNTTPYKLYPKEKYVLKNIINLNLTDEVIKALSNFNGSTNENSKRKPSLDLTMFTLLFLISLPGINTKLEAILKTIRDNGKAKPIFEFLRDLKKNEPITRDLDEEFRKISGDIKPMDLSLSCSITSFEKFDQEGLPAPYNKEMFEVCQNLKYTLNVLNISYEKQIRDLNSKLDEEDKDSNGKIVKEIFGSIPNGEGDDGGEGGEGGGGEGGEGGGEGGGGGGEGDGGEGDGGEGDGGGGEGGGGEGGGGEGDGGGGKPGGGGGGKPGGGGGGNEGCKNNWEAGYTYMPPKCIRRMQKKPKNCIIDPYKLNEPVAILTDGAPVNALEYTKVGSMLPPFKYTEYSFDEKNKVAEGRYPKVNMLQGYEADSYSKFN